MTNNTERTSEEERIRVLEEQVKTLLEQHVDILEHLRELAQVVVECAIDFEEE
tara:strand:- start:60 stop:218 length:159 start_codon:yes stop_codon:yes gene_type:complete